MIYIVSVEVVTVVGDSFGPSVSSTNIRSYVMLFFLLIYARNSGAFWALTSNVQC